MTDNSSAFNMQKISYSCDLSIVIPVFGSAFILPDLYRRLKIVMQSLGQSYEIIFVEDSGPDNAWQVLQEIAMQDDGVYAIELMKNSGQSNATLCGLAHAKGQFIITMDDDLQHPPEEIPRLFQALHEHIDVVMGVAKKRQHHWFRRLGSDLLHQLNCYLLGKDRKLRFTSFRLMRRSVVEILLENRTLYPALGSMIYSATHRVMNTEVEHAPRHLGVSQYTFTKLFTLSMSNFIGHTLLPFRILAIISLLGFSLAIVLAVVILFFYFFRHWVLPGWAAVGLFLLMIFSFNCLVLALFGEYLLRILQAVNGVPPYVVRTTIHGGRQKNPPSLRN